MASPNASLALRLQQSHTYAICPPTYRESWLKQALRIPEDRMKLPVNGEVFETLPKDEMGPAILKRLMDYGFVAGVEFKNKRADWSHHSTPNILFTCRFSGTKKANNHKIQSETVEYDPVTKQRIPDRQRDRDDERRGCPVAYRVSYKYSREAGEKQWIGHWCCDDPEVHTGHPFPFNPMEFRKHKTSTTDYQLLETVGRKYRSAKVPYSQARKLFLEEGTRMVMTQKEYYNLASRKVKDLTKDDTAGALCAVLDRDGWKYCLRLEKCDNCETITGEDDICDRGHKIIQVFFWYDHTRDIIRRFTSNALLVVDATFRTNKKGLPLIIAVGKSNTNKTLPVAFSWAPEEDGESYKFFYQCLREELYQGVPEPAVVLTDLSAGMTRAYDKLECLPNSELQYCYYHALDAMIDWFTKHKYLSEDIAALTELCKEYLNSLTAEALETNRANLIDVIQAFNPGDEAYIIDNWLQREERLIKCYVKHLTNLDQYATQRGESFNRKMHQWTNHQMTLQEAASKIIDAVEDIFRDFGHDAERARIKNRPGVPRQPFSLLSGSITLEAIDLVNRQWTKLTTNTASSHCTGSFRKQNLLPCAHDLRYAYEHGLPIPLSMVHPRWWIAGHTPQEKDWTPSYELIEAVIAPPAEQDLQTRVNALFESRAGLEGEEQRGFDSMINAILDRAAQIGNNRRAHSSVRLEMPDDRRGGNKKIMTNEQKRKVEQKREAVRTALANRERLIIGERTERVLSTHATSSQANSTSQARATLPPRSPSPPSFEDTLVISPKQPPPPRSPSPPPPPSFEDTLVISPKQPPPPASPSLFEHPSSTAPTGTEAEGSEDRGRGKRKRKDTLFTEALGMLAPRKRS